MDDMQWFTASRAVVWAWFVLMFVWRIDLERRCATAGGRVRRPLSLVRGSF